MPKEMLTLYTKLFVDRGNGDENLIDLLSTPDLGIGDPEKVEVTNLQDGTRRYINGLKDVGDSLEFEFNYTTDGYEKLKEIEESKEIYVYKVVLPDELCFEFEAALSVKITGAAVGEQIKMTINLTPYSAIKVGQYGENGSAQVNEYSTFRIGAIPQTFNMRSGETTGTMNLYYNEEEPIYEVYINNEPQELPTGKINNSFGDEPATVYEVKEGDIIKIRGGFSLFRTGVPLEDIVIQDGLKNCEGMFSECLGLTVAPVIPSSVKNCSNMFEGCTNLAVIPQENIDLINNPPAGLVFEDCFKNCPLVADQIPVEWGGNKVEEPELVNEYTTFTINSGDRIRISIEDVAEPAITELYINGEQQELPELPESPESPGFPHLPGSPESPGFPHLPGSSGFPGSSGLEREYEVEEGQEVKIKGHFKLRDANIARVKLQSNLTDCREMFDSVEMKVAPVIPSSVTNCEGMFSGCRDLLIAPTIPSSVTNCSSMFSYCGSLTEAPIIPLSVTNCEGMFEGCSALTEAPVIPEGITNCSSMFLGCGSLTKAPEIPSTVTNCFNMFMGCGSLTEAPVIPSSVTDCQDMFRGCTSLIEAPEILEGVTSCEGMFNSCTSLTEAPVIPNSVTNCGGMFVDCTSLTEAPVIPEGVTNCGAMFVNCTSLTEAPIIPSSVTNCSSMFRGCTSLIEAPVIPNSVTNCEFMFGYCGSLTTIPSENVDLMYNHNDELQHEACYTFCDRIINPITYDEIPDDWKLGEW